MRTNKSLIVAALAAMLVGADAAIVAAANYTESVNGDLSGTPASPTPWTLALGANVLTGAAGTAGVTSDYDLVSFTLPTGLQLDSIQITAFHNTFGQSFFGLQPDTPWLDGLGYAMNGTYIYGYGLVFNNTTQTNLLQTMLDNAFTPFSIPLPSGVYTLETQDVDTTFTYSLTFNVSRATVSIGNFNADAFVNAADLTKWSADFGPGALSDADGDGDSDGADFMRWQRYSGAGPYAVAAPEPSSLALAAVVSMALARGRRSVAVRA